MSLSNDLLDSFTVRAVSVERFTVGEQQRVVKMLEGLERNLLSELAEMNPSDVKGAWRRRRLDALVRQSRATIDEAYRSIQSSVRANQRRVATAESLFTRNAVNQAVGIDLMSTAVSPELLRRVVNDVAVERIAATKWWKAQSQAAHRTFESVVREGVLRGESVDVTARRLRGLGEFAHMRNSQRWKADARALVHTSTQTVVNEARVETFRANDDVVGNMQWVSTLDSRTTQLCIERDGLIYTLDGEPVGHNVLWDAGPGAIHWNCRSTVVPVVKAFEKMRDLKTGGRPTADAETYFRRELERQGFDKGEIDSIMRQGMNRLDGKAAETTTYRDWLRKQSPATQDKVLGKARAEAFRAGKIESQASLASQANRPMSVSHLQSPSIGNIPESFNWRALPENLKESRSLAGLDPNSMKYGREMKRLKTIRALQRAGVDLSALDDIAYNSSKFTLNLNKIAKGQPVSLTAKPTPSVPQAAKKPPKVKGAGQKSDYLTDSKADAAWLEKQVDRLLVLEDEYIEDDLVFDPREKLGELLRNSGMSKKQIRDLRRFEVMYEGGAGYDEVTKMIGIDLEFFQSAPNLQRIFTHEMGHHIHINNSKFYDLINDELTRVWKEDIKAAITKMEANPMVPEFEKRLVRESSAFLAKVDSKNFFNVEGAAEAYREMQPLTAGSFGQLPALEAPAGFERAYCLVHPCEWFAEFVSEMRHAPAARRAILESRYPKMVELVRSAGVIDI